MLIFLFNIITPQIDNLLRQQSIFYSFEKVYSHQRHSFEKVYHLRFIHSKKCDLRNGVAGGGYFG